MFEISSPGGGHGSESIWATSASHRAGTVFYQIGKGLPRVRVREALRAMGLDPDAWMWMYNGRSGVLRIL
jgi:hypothetical protein